MKKIVRDKINSEPPKTRNKTKEDILWGKNSVDQKEKMNLLFFYDRSSFLNG
jgi:hypothetical protein